MKKKRKKPKIKGFILLFLIIYLIAMAAYYIYMMPVKKIIVKNNKYTEESEIIKKAGLDKEVAIFKVSSSKMKKNIMSLDYIKNVKITKNILGKVTIEVEEENILFYNNLTSKYVLSNGKEIELEDVLLGKPTLINYVPEDILKEFCKELNEIDKSVVAMISEIEYSPDIKEEVVIDEERFLLKMNDQNAVYVNVINLNKLNKYKEAIAAVYDQTPGILSLDSNSNNTLFRSYAKIQQVEEEQLTEENENVSEEGE